MLELEKKTEATDEADELPEDACRLEESDKARGRRVVILKRTEPKGGGGNNNFVLDHASRFNM